MDETQCEAAVLSLLEQRAELYPRQVVHALEGDGLASAMVVGSLARLYESRRVARLLGRYVPADAVDDTRARWLMRLSPSPAHGAETIRARVSRWSGWND